MKCRTLSDRTCTVIQANARLLVRSAVLNLIGVAWHPKPIECVSSIDIDGGSVVLLVGACFSISRSPQHRIINWCLFALD